MGASYAVPLAYFHKEILVLGSYSSKTTNWDCSAEEICELYYCQVNLLIIKRRRQYKNIYIYPIVKERL